MSRPFAEWDIYKAVADPTRRAILTSLSQGDKNVTELLEPHNISMPALSRHLTILREVGLVTQERRGRHRLYKLSPTPLRDISDWLAQFEHFWDDKLDALAIYLGQEGEDHE